jgi:pyruvate carboxylase
MLLIADAYSRLAPQLFSLEMWGGATFDTSMRFLSECPWKRLSEMRERIPNILFQMLLRASNAVGYTNYPDNVVKAFVKEAAMAGVDIFRVFDALNWTENMQVAMEAVVESGMICEAAICYTGDITNPNRTKYSLKYYVELAKQLEKMGAHMLAIKDMAGLCKPIAAKLLVSTLKKEIGIPIHFHTHDTAGIQASSILNAADEGLEIADGACASMSGGTSQVNLNTLIEALRFSPRQSQLDTDAMTQISEYWKAARQFYAPFESESLVAAGDLYQHEMPGGQYTNLYQQAKALGLAEQWSDVCKRYADANQLLGDIVKVTPTSKAIGDLALFMVANHLSADDIAEGRRDIDYPGSVLDLVGGMMGQPPGGFPANVKKSILKDKQEVVERPGVSLPPEDFDAIRTSLKSKFRIEPTPQDVVTSALYPKVFDDFLKQQTTYSDLSILPTPIFFYGPEVGEEFSIDIETGKRLIIKFLTVGDPRPDGTRVVFFELNGQPREIEVKDRSIEGKAALRVKADPADPTHVAAGMPGMVIGVTIAVGDVVKKGQKLLALEAMKMETIITADRDGEVVQLQVKSGSQVETGDLLLVLK